MLRVLAVDDEPLALRQVVAYIQRLPSLSLVAACHSALEAREWLQSEEVDAIFCDINMPDLNGLDFVRQMSPAPLVVFTTAYSQYAIEGFRVDAVDYLLKPYSFSEFSASVERLCRRYELISAAKSAGGGPAPEPPGLYLRADHRTLSVPFSDIIHVQSMGEYLRFYLTSQPRPLMTLMSMKRLEESLPADRFLRIHRSHVINLQYVTEVGKGRVMLSDGADLPIGDNYRAAFSMWLHSQMPGK